MTPHSAETDMIGRAAGTDNVRTITPAATLEQGSRDRHPAGKQLDADLATLRATIAACHDLADQWEAEADSWDGPAHVDVVAAAHAYARELRAALTLGWP